jgi:NAD-dependent dihydropyrimidine dehydrogenase PreA subunit
MSITFKEMMSPTVTENYPDEPPKFEERYRGSHVLQRDQNGLEKCVACFLCAAACPANCIYIEAAENTERTRISGGERYASVYNNRLQPLHFLRLLRGSLPHRRHHTRSRLRSGELQYIYSCEAQGRHAGSHAQGAKPPVVESETVAAH